MELQTRFCTSPDGTQLAYATVGDGRPLIYCPGWGGCIDIDWERPEGRAFIEGLAAHRLLVTPYARGVGASQREVDDLSPEALLADLETVVEHLGATELDLLGQESGAATSLAYAARHPERVGRIVLWQPVVFGEDAGREDTFVGMIEMTKRNWRIVRQTMADSCFPSGPIEWQRFAADYFRESISKEIAAKYFQATLTLDARSLAALVQAPTLVLHRRLSLTTPIAAGRATAALIPDASFIVLEGDASWIYFEYEQVLDAITGFLDDEQILRAAGPHGAGFRTVLFTDLVGHTEMMSRLGDERGREVLREHERITRDVLKEHDGSEVKTMGDGFMASFGSITRAIDCAIALQRAFAQHNASPSEQLKVRVGLNAGEPIEEDGDLFGSTVSLASRIAAKAGAGEILIPEPLRHLLTGKSYVYADRGETMLKGFEDAVRLFEVRWQEGSYGPTAP